MVRLTTVCLLMVTAFATHWAHATDRSFRDIEATSQSGRYKVTAKSPDNVNPKGRVAFQSNFVYECTDTQTKKVMWTRKQVSDKPKAMGDALKGTDTQLLDGPPCMIYVSDSGYTIVYTDSDNLIVVDPKGKKSESIDILRGCFSIEEYDKYVSLTTAGPMWAHRSHWYFVSAESKEYFIIRPWWGRHVIVELTNGEIKTPTESLNKAILQSEKEYVIRALKAVHDNPMKQCECCGESYEVAIAAYLAGVLKVKETVPMLRTLERSTHVGSSVFGGFDEVEEGRVHPFNYSTYDTRQDVHLALRRLGEKPTAFPCTSFKPLNLKNVPDKPYARKPVPGTRESNAEKVKKGMSPEQVIDLIDCPDYVPDREWQYDIDAEKPYTLTLSWSKNGTVENVKIVRPALWQKGTVRDDDR